MPTQHYRRTPVGSSTRGSPSTSSTPDTHMIVGSSHTPATDTAGGSSSGGSAPSSSTPAALSPATQDAAPARLEAVEETDEADAAPQAPADELGPRDAVGRILCEPVGKIR